MQRECTGLHGCDEAGRAALRGRERRPVPHHRHAKRLLGRLGLQPQRHSRSLHDDLRPRRWRAEPMASPPRSAPLAPAARLPARPAADARRQPGSASPSDTTVDPTAQCGSDPTCQAFAAQVRRSRFQDHRPLQLRSESCRQAIRMPARHRRATSTRAATLVDIQFPVPVDCLPTASATSGPLAESTRPQTRSCRVPTIRQARGSGDR